MILNVTVSKNGISSSRQYKVSNKLNNANFHGHLNSWVTPDGNNENHFYAYETGTGFQHEWKLYDADEDGNPVLPLVPLQTSTTWEFHLNN